MLEFTKKVGLNRGNTRLFFETDKIQEYGFVPGARYDADVFSFSEGKFDLMLVLHHAGRRSVCKKIKGSRVLSVIDINTALHMSYFPQPGATVYVTVRPGWISVRNYEKEMTCDS